MKVSVTKLFEFEACHHLPNYDGDCRNMHGHSYKLEVEVGGHVDEFSGMVVDFKDLKEVVKVKVLDKYDHANLNDFFDMPTAENMVEEIAHQVSAEMLIAGRRSVVRVRLWETSTSYAEVKI
jgi:6-pyruvoyltetrahydropterin/6-carboxytetrahydropterin synthase